MSTLKYIGIQTDFEQIFFKREFRALAGQRFGQLGLLFIILLVTLIALGYAIGGLQLLHTRMNNPYTNWVDVTVKNQDRDTIDAIIRHFEKPGATQAFLIKNVTDHVMIMDRIFVGQQDGQKVEFRGRTISQKDVILETILSEKEGNLLGGQAFEAGKSIQFSSLIGIIATEAMLTKLGYSNPRDQKQIYANVNGIYFLVPIEAVVKELPNFCDYCFTPEFYNLYLSNYVESRFLPIYSERGSVNMFDFISEHLDSAKIINWWERNAPQLGILSVDCKQLVMNTTEKHVMNTVTLGSFPSAAKLDSIFERFQQFSQEQGDRINVVYKPNLVAAHTPLDRPHAIAFNFEYLDKIEDFKVFMLREFGFEINVAQIEAKKNFAIVSNLTAFMAVVLFFFSIASIISFVDSLLRAHIEKIKPNLGTFMAFGLSNETLLKSYLRIIAVFMGITLLAALLIAFAYDLVEDYFMALSRFDLFDWRVAVAVLILLAIGYLKSIMTINAILKNTPGNLIYERENY
jgi:hypothetical protein